MSNTHQGIWSSTQGLGLSELYETNGGNRSPVRVSPSSVNHGGMEKPHESVRKKFTKKQLSRQRQQAAQKAAQEEFYLENYLINGWGSPRDKVSRLGATGYNNNYLGEDDGDQWFFED